MFACGKIWMFTLARSSCGNINGCRMRQEAAAAVMKASTCNTCMVEMYEVAAGMEAVSAARTGVIMAWKCCCHEYNLRGNNQFMIVHKKNSHYQGRKKQ